MLLEFKVSNYRSIAKEQVLSLVPAKKQRDYPENINIVEKYKALNALSLYGPNSGGKSNLIKAMGLFDHLIRTSMNTSSKHELPYDPFLLVASYSKKPTEFEATILINGDRYRYGFAFNRKEIVNEYLYRKKVGREVRLFDRDKDIIEASPSFENTSKLVDIAIDATRNNALFLSTCDTFNIQEAKLIFDWFSRFTVVDGLNTEDESFSTFNLWEDEPVYQPRISKYMNKLGLGIVDVDVKTKKMEASDLPPDMPVSLSSKLIGEKGYKAIAIHQTYDDDGNALDEFIGWDFEDRESSGGNKSFDLSGPILKTLSQGGVLVIDEVEAKLHPLMTINTIETFLKRSSNPNQAQIIFSTHDTNILSYTDLRRDQICFAEKNKWESTETYSLSDFMYYQEKNGEFTAEKERPDTDKESRYFEGKYGAIPVLGDFRKYIQDLWLEKGK